MQPLAAQFQQYLARLPLSPATRKNYISDVNLFLEALAKELQEKTIRPAHINERVINDYGRRLNQATADPYRPPVSPATAERRLASLKRFGKWLAESGRADADPAAGLISLRVDPTLNQLLKDFKNELARQKLSASTGKNYVSDVNNYLLWAIKYLKITDDNSIKL